MANSQVLTRDAYGVTYADPASPDFTVRFKTNRNKKGLNGVQVDNYLTEIIVNDANEVTVGNTTANDALSIRIRVSGSDKSLVRLSAVLNSICSQVPAWTTENVILGFEPTTSPINPA